MQKIKIFKLKLIKFYGGFIVSGHFVIKGRQNKDSTKDLKIDVK